jgi:hypothetical protein
VLVSLEKRLLTIPIALCAGLLSLPLHAGDFAAYRQIQFGANLSAVAKQAGANPAEARTLHQHPALIQELDWRPRSPAITDPMKEGLLCFINGDLFRIIVTYDRYKTEGMTVDDMIEAISATYGTATKPTAEVVYHSIYGESAPVLARWDNADYSYDLIRTGDQAGFAMVLYSKRLDAQAQASITESVRLEALDAPQREIEKQKMRDDQEHIVLEKARAANRPNFRP